MLTKLINMLLVLLGKCSEKQLLKVALQSYDHNEILQLLARLSGDNDRRVREIVPKIQRRFPVYNDENKDKDGPIFCYECKVKEGEYHQIGCFHGLCANARSDGSCASPMRLLTPDEAPASWDIPPPAQRSTIFYARLPSRCDECGYIGPMFGGEQ